MKRFFIPREAVRGKEMIITGEEAHHILNVMRLKKGNRLAAFDGTGKEYIGFIKEVKPSSLSVEISETRSSLSKSGSELTLIQAILKKEKMDHIVEKATELGVSSVIPTLTARTIPKWDASKKDLQAARWRKIAKEASKQCGRADIPKVEDIRDFRDAVRSGDYDLRLIAVLGSHSVRLKDALVNFKGERVAIAIGPEGDFTPAEVKEAKEAGFKLVSLGTRVLKSDTAGLAALAILNHEFSD